MDEKIMETEVIKETGEELATNVGTNKLGWILGGVACAAAAGFGLYKLIKNKPWIKEKVVYRFVDGEETNEETEVTEG